MSVLSTDALIHPQQIAHTKLGSTNGEWFHCLRLHSLIGNSPLRIHYWRQAPPLETATAFNPLNFSGPPSGLSDRTLPVNLLVLLSFRPTQVINQVKPLLRLLYLISYITIYMCIIMWEVYMLKCFWKCSHNALLMKLSSISRLNCLWLSVH